MPDPAGVRERLRQAGADPGFRGMMVDHRYDRAGALLARDEVLRVREFRPPPGAGSVEIRISWKGPVSVTAKGYKTRRELEYAIQACGPAGSPFELLGVLGFEEIHRIERYVEYYRLGTADVRLEWYPRMDVLVEVEGDEAGIEAALPVIGLPRTEYSAEPLPMFVARYAARTGSPAVLALGALNGDLPSWDAG